MEKQITIKREYNSLETVLEHLKMKTPFECSLEYDSWDIRTDSQGKMEKCIVVKKSNMHGMKMYFTKENVLKLSYIIPNKLMNAYFGKSVKSHKNILEILTGIIKNALLSGSQKKAFDELGQSLTGIAA